MNKSEAIAIAKSKKATQEQLRQAMGHGDEVNRLLAKNPQRLGRNA